MLHIYNSLTRQKELFVPIAPNRVRLYVCGITAYDYCHIGHARVMVVFDMVVRYLRFLGYEVTYVRNITDIDDKIIKRAAELNEPVEQLTDRFIRAMHEDAQALGVLPPTHEPRATHHIDDIIALIQRLLEKGAAYIGANRDVYYAVNQFVDYGRLANKRLDELRAGIRVEVDAFKRDPLDFVLWKAAKPDEPSWDSPWGKGRPGWHIECSAMSMCHLGEHFDIHGGGMDLKFPHHENEIAQSEAATGHPYVNYWMHNGFVQINDEKMSKSLGNFVTVRDVLTQHKPETLRFFILQSHYRGPLVYSESNLKQAETALRRLYLALRDVASVIQPLEPIDKMPGLITEAEKRFQAAMDDDFNTPEAITVLFDLATELNKAKAENNQRNAVELAAALQRWGESLGLLQSDPESFLRTQVTVRFPYGVEPNFTDTDIENLIAQRNQARQTKNWKAADRIRNQLSDMGIILEDRADGTRWRRE